MGRVVQVLYRDPFVIIDSPVVPGSILMGHGFMVRTGLYQISARNIAVHAKFVYSLSPPESGVAPLILPLSYIIDRA